MREIYFICFGLLLFIFILANEVGKLKIRVKTIEESKK
jgi:hypothetical protein